MLNAKFKSTSKPQR
jgi:hypothetical protein